jgi:hypothetical protein
MARPFGPGSSVLISGLLAAIAVAITFAPWYHRLPACGYYFDDPSEQASSLFYTEANFADD